MSVVVDELRTAIVRGSASTDRLFVAGICGAQGSGKSTMAAALAERFDRSAVLSLDDLYLTRAERETLAASVHPLLRTRGVPGTHDVALGLQTIAALERGEAAPLPRFDKASDDRAPRADWPIAPEATELLILEGWCLGARPQDEAALAAPVNRLEREEDANEAWRRHANDALAGDYQRLFARIDLLALLAAPDFDCVLGWRRQQEDELRQRTGRGMSEAELTRFVAHYERLTRHILTEVPPRADVLVELAADRSARRVVTRASGR